MSSIKSLEKIKNSELKTKEIFFDKSRLSDINKTKLYLTENEPEKSLLADKNTTKVQNIENFLEKSKENTDNKLLSTDSITNKILTTEND